MAICRLLRSPLGVPARRPALAVSYRTLRRPEDDRAAWRRAGVCGSVGRCSSPWLRLRPARTASPPRPGATAGRRSATRRSAARTRARESRTRLDRSFVLPVDGRITGQVLAAHGRFYAATTAGDVVAFTSGGYVLWHDDFGQLAQTCPQLDGYGIVGTGVIDQAASTLYVADAFGRLHALDLATGGERSGRPTRPRHDECARRRVRVRPRRDVARQGARVELARRYRWQERPTGVYATENGGRSWRQIFRGTPLGRCGSRARPA